MFAGHWFVSNISICDVDTADLMAASEDCAVAVEAGDKGGGIRDEERNDERFWALKFASEASSGTEPEVNVSAS